MRPNSCALRCPTSRTQSNTHEVVRSVSPEARVVYVDMDPMAGVLDAELLTDDGATAVVVADLRDPDSVLGNPQLKAQIDFDQPLGLLMTALLQFVPDEDKLPPRSVKTGVEVYQRATASVFPRTKAEIERFFTGLELVPPFAGAQSDLTNAGLWGSEDPTSADTDGSRAFYCGVARCGRRPHRPAAAGGGLNSSA